MTDCQKLCCTGSFMLGTGMLDGYVFTSLTAQKGISTMQASQLLAGTDVHQWEDLTMDRCEYVEAGTATAKADAVEDAEARRKRIHERATGASSPGSAPPTFTCRFCGRGLPSRIGHFSHERPSGPTLPSDQLILNVILCPAMSHTR